MVSEIIKLLTDDTTLKTKLGATTGDTHIYPLYTMNNNECIIYKHVPVSDDGIKTIDRLEITIIASTYAKTLEIEECVKSILLTIGDTPLNTLILEVELNGGGALYDGQRDKVHRILFLNILYRR